MTSPLPSNLSRPGTTLAAIACLIAAGLLAWANSFSGPFVFDDRPAILANPTLHHFGDALFPPRDGGTVAGRPLVNLSLALNFALSGTSVWSYHALNLAIHLLAGFTLFGLIRRTLLLANRPAAATPIAFAASLLWLLHPLQTAAVTYVIQRAESLMAFFLLLTLYGFVRAVTVEEPAAGARRNRWFAFSVACCFAGMACKEVMVVAPLLVWLHDRTFVSGTFAAALRRHARYYLALAGSWALLAWLVAGSDARSGTAGFTGAIAPLDYAFTQCAAIVRYLALAVWPRTLVFDYGTPVITSFADIWPQALLLCALIAGIVVAALRRAPAFGFLGIGFFLVLAPSSSVMPIATQTIAEHRMYLPLAAITTALAIGLHRVAARWAMPVAAVLALLLGIATAQRNRDYRDAATLWGDTVAKRPENPRARNHLAVALARAGRTSEAIPHYEAALRLSPGDAEVHHNLANALKETGRPSEALTHYAASVQLRPDSLAAQVSLASALAQTGRMTDALEHYAAAEKLGSLDAHALSAYGAALASSGKPAEAIPRYERALQLAPQDAQIHYNLGLAHARTGQFAAAIEHFRRAAQLEPANLPARVNLGNALLVAGRTTEAIAEYESALRLRPDDPQIRANLARARAQSR